MKKSLLVAVSCFSLAVLWISPLSAMEEEPRERVQIKASTIYNRAQRDHYLERGDNINAAHFAMKVINEDPEDTEADDNPDAIIDDFRKARDICGCVSDYLSDATSYAEGVRAFKNQVTLQDLIIAKELYQRDQNHEFVAYYERKISEHSSMETKK